jgi:hypothetical protein
MRILRIVLLVATGGALALFVFGMVLDYREFGRLTITPRWALIGLPLHAPEQPRRPRRSA